MPVKIGVNPVFQVKFLLKRKDDEHMLHPEEDNADT